MPCHMGSLDDVRSLVAAAVDRFGGLDVVVNNAANALTEPVGAFTEAAFAKSVDVNVRGPVFLVQEALPHLKASEHASVINVVSAGAWLFSAPVAMYAAAKAAMVSYTKSMAADLAPARGAGQRPGARHGRHRHGAGERSRGGRVDGPVGADAARRRPRRDGGTRPVPGLRRLELRHGLGGPRRRRARHALTRARAAAVLRPRP